MSETELKPGARQDGQVNCKLAHPIDKPDHLRALGLDPDQPVGVGDVITVDVWRAQGLIGAGLVQVDPEDLAAVRVYLHGLPPAPGVAPAENVDPGVGGGAQPIDLVHDDEPLIGAALDEALDEASLSKSGTVKEKQARLAAYVPEPVED